MSKKRVWSGELLICTETILQQYKHVNRTNSVQVCPNHEGNTCTSISLDTTGKQTRNTKKKVRFVLLSHLPVVVLCTQRRGATLHEAKVRTLQELSDDLRQAVLRNSEEPTTFTTKGKWEGEYSY